jgi:predicted RNA binding protein YcfA (HicA-like mRNA interferase family)
MRLTPVSRDELIRRLRKLGWTGPFPGKKHSFMLKGSDVLTIPNPHGSKDIGVNLLKEILKEADVTREEWLKGR